MSLAEMVRRLPYRRNEPAIKPVGITPTKGDKKMKSNELLEKGLDSISDEDLKTVCGGLTAAVTLATYEAAVCISQL
jgi:hypothetical protein